MRRMRALRLFIDAPDSSNKLVISWKDCARDVKTYGTLALHKVRL